MIQTISEACLLARERADGLLSLAQAGAVLGFLIVGGGGIYAQIACSERFPLLPTEASFMPSLHKIPVNEIAIEPQICSLTTKPLVNIVWSVKLKFADRHVCVSIWHQNFINRESLFEGIDGQCRQPVADIKSNLDFNRKTFGLADVIEDQTSYVTASFSSITTALRDSIAKTSARIGADNGKLDCDCCVSGPLGGTSGGSCGSSQAYREYTEYNSKGSNNRSRDGRNIVMIGVDKLSDVAEDHAYKGGMVFFGTLFVFLGFAAIYWRLVNGGWR